MTNTTARPGAAATAASGQHHQRGADSGVRALVLVRDRGIVVLWLVLVAVFAFWGHPYFFTWTNAALVANAAAETAIFAAAIALAVLSGALDLSIPASAALASVVTGHVLLHGGPTWFAVVLGVLMGVLVGMVNGLLTTRGLNPLVVTIASLTTVGGIANLVSGGLAITGVSQISWLGTDTLHGVPAPVFVVAVVYLLGWIFLTRTRAGGRLQAVGGNSEAARRVGLRADRYRVLGFVLGGAVGAIGGLTVTAVTLQASPTPSVDLLFTGITAVALSGMSLGGGRGSLPRVLVGALIIATINSVLVIRHIQPYWTTVATGVLLVLALVFEKETTRAVVARLAAVTVAGDGKEA